MSLASPPTKHHLPFKKIPDTLSIERHMYVTQELTLEVKYILSRPALIMADVRAGSSFKRTSLLLPIHHSRGGCPCEVENY